MTDPGPLRLPVALDLLVPAGGHSGLETAPLHRRLLPGAPLLRLREMMTGHLLPSIGEGLGSGSPENPGGLLR